MNIAVLNFHRLGGSGIIAYEIAQTLVKRGHNVHFLGLKPPLRFHKDESNMIFHSISMKIYPVFDFQPYTLALASQLSELIKKCNIQVIHSHYAIPHAIAALLARDIAKKEVNCITTLHGTDITVVGTHPSMYNITKYSIEKSDHVTAVSNYLTEKTTLNFNLAKNKIKTIYNFISNDFLSTQEFKPKGLNPEKISIIHSSNLREIKAPLEIIEIFHKIVKSNKRVDFQLGILGDGPFKKKMGELAEKFNLSKKITFYGEKLNFRSIYQKADFFLLPSYDESFGLAALEAMAYGIPVFARGVGGLVEVINDGQDGFLFCENHEKITEPINQMIQNPELYQKISTNAYKKVVTSFPAEKIIDQYEELYNRK